MRILKGAFWSKWQSYFFLFCLVFVTVCFSFSGERYVDCILAWVVGGSEDVGNILKRVFGSKFYYVPCNSFSYSLFISKLLHLWICMNTSILRSSAALRTSRGGSEECILLWSQAWFRWYHLRLFNLWNSCFQELVFNPHLEQTWFL